MVKIPKNQKKAYHKGLVKKSILIKADKEKVWRKISNIVGLAEWVVDVKKTEFVSKSKRGVGAIRNITFKDGNEIEEHVVAWKNKEYFSYLAISGLPLKIYHATISIKKKNSMLTRVTWKSYLLSKKMSKKEFNEFVSFMNDFYKTSLKNLKLKLER